MRPQALIDRGRCLCARIDRFAAQPEPVIGEGMQLKSMCQQFISEARDLAKLNDSHDFEHGVTVDLFRRIAGLILYLESALSSGYLDP